MADFKAKVQMKNDCVSGHFDRFPIGVTKKAYRIYKLNLLSQTCMSLDQFIS
jgi:hypothetical protein